MIVVSNVTTPNRERWELLATALGATVHGDVAEFAGGRMTFADGEPSATITLEADLDSLENHPGLEREGEVAVLRHEAMPDLVITAQAGERTGSGFVQVAPLITTPEVETIADLVAHLGLKRRLTSDEGRYADLVADGILAVHIGTPDFVIGLEAPDLDTLLPRLAEAGFRATMIDENYGRTLRIEHPDNPAQEAEIWVNESQTDTYGYTAH